jgi:hypothetical protein
MNKCNYQALETCKNLIGIEQQLTEIGLPMPLLMDNQAAIIILQQ